MFSTLSNLLPVSIFTLLSLTDVAWTQTPEERGLEIAQMMKSAGEGFMSDSSEMEMILIDSYGTRVSRKMKGTSMEGANGEDRAITEFLSPADVKGTKLLTHSHKGEDDDQWLFLPAMKERKELVVALKVARLWEVSSAMKTLVPKI